MKNVALIGLGPHSKRIYLNYFEKNKDVNFKLLIDLESNKEKIEKYLAERNFKNIKLFLMPDIFKDSEIMPAEIENALDRKSVV